MGAEIKHPATIDKAGLREGAKYYGAANASPCTIDGHVYGAELVLECYIGTYGKDRLFHGHYVCRIRRPSEAELPTCAFRTLPGWEPKVEKPAAPQPVALKPTRTNTRKAVRSNGVHTQN